MELLLFYFLTLSGITYCVEVTKMRVIEDEDVILPCSLDSTNIQSEVFDWKKDDQKEVFLYSSGSHYNNGRSGQDPQFKGRVFHFDDQLQSGVASIEIRKTKVTDSGRYSCIFPFLQPMTRSMIELIVASPPKPYVTILHETNDQALLECEVLGAFPKPKVQWLDSDNNTVPAEEPQVTESDGKYNIILKTTVTKTDYYRCVSTREQLSHQIDNKIHVNFNEKQPEPAGACTKWIVAFTVVTVLFLVAVGFAIYFKLISDKAEHEGMKFESELFKKLRLNEDQQNDRLLPSGRGGVI